MIAILSSLLLSLSASTLAFPSLGPRTVTSLDEAAFEEAQQRDNTATRAFSSTEIKTSDGQCLFVDELSGDFRANLTPIQVAACNGSTGQLWDIITAGVHDNVPGTALVVNTLTQACMNFDPRRAAGNTVIMFSCGGRADGGGTVTNSQTFPFSGGAGPLALSPSNANGTCFTVTAANVIDEAACDPADPNQAFTFAGSESVASTPSSVLSPATSIAAVVSVTPAASTTTVAAATLSSSLASPVATSPSASTTAPAVPTTISTVVVASGTAPPTLDTSGIPDFSPTTPVTVSGAGGILQPSAVAESNPRDDTATRAFSAVPIKAPNGQCLFINPLAGDFRENLIPIQTADCTGSANELFDIITAGVHNNAPNSTLIVSTVTQGCLNFDPRRAVGDTVIMFSCGGRADGGGTVTNSQLFSFNGTTTLALEPENDVGTCLDIDATGRVDSAPCTGDATQLFTIG